MTELGVNSLTDLLDAVAAQIANQVAEQVIDQIRADQHAASERWMATRDAAAYLGLTVDALHKLTASRAIPFEQDRPGGKCWFNRHDLDAWRREH